MEKTSANVLRTLHSWLHRSDTSTLNKADSDSSGLDESDDESPPATQPHRVSAPKLPESVDDDLPPLVPEDLPPLVPDDQPPLLPFHFKTEPSTASTVQISELKKPALSKEDQDAFRALHKNKIFINHWKIIHLHQLPGSFDHFIEPTLIFLQGVAASTSSTKKKKRPPGKNWAKAYFIYQGKQLRKNDSLIVTLYENEKISPPRLTRIFHAAGIITRPKPIPKESATKYTPLERQLLLQWRRYRDRKNASTMIRYASRKKFADSRGRNMRGRFFSDKAVAGLMELSTAQHLVAKP